MPTQEKKMADLNNERLIILVHNTWSCIYHSLKTYQDINTKLILWKEFYFHFKFAVKKLGESCILQLPA